jgi:hypothetical protein
VTDATGVVGMEMRKKHRLGMNAQTRELRGQILTRFLPVGDAVDPKRSAGILRLSLLCVRSYRACPRDLLACGETSIS